MNRQMDMLHGSIWDKLILFALPLAFSSVLQQLFNAADVAVVGRFAGDSALAAVGANGPVINLFINLFVGLSVGTNAVVSRYIGEDNTGRIQQAIHTSILLALVSGFILLGVGQIAARPILSLMATPENILDQAILYLQIYFLGMPFLMLFNFSSAILRSKGDTRRPLISLATAGIFNVIFNVIFVVVFQMGVAGVAIATCISSGISAAACLYFLMHEEERFRFTLSKMRFHWLVLKQICIIGVPAGLQGVIFSLSNTTVQSAINKLGHLYIAGSTAALNYEIICYYIANSFNAAALTFISQNYAAGNLERCQSIVRWAVLLTVLSMIGSGAILILTKDLTLSLFTASSQVAAIASIRIVIIVAFESLNGLIEVFSGILRGFGKSFIPTAIAIVGICGLRILIVSMLPSNESAFPWLMSVYPISWVVTSSALFIAYRIQARKLVQRPEGSMDLARA